MKFDNVEVRKCLVDFNDTHKIDYEIKNNKIFNKKKWKLKYNQKPKKIWSEGPNNEQRKQHLFLLKNQKPENAYIPGSKSDANYLHPPN